MFVLLIYASALREGIGRSFFPGAGRKIQLHLGSVERRDGSLREVGHRSNQTTIFSDVWFGSFTSFPLSRRVRFAARADIRPMPAFRALAPLSPGLSHHAASSNPMSPKRMGPHSVLAVPDPWSGGPLSGEWSLREKRRLPCALQFWRRELSLHCLPPPWRCQWLPCLTCRSQSKFMDATTTTLMT